MRVKTIVPIDQMSSPKSGPLNKKFEKLVKDTLDFWHVPGISIAVVDGDNVYSQGYGIASFPDTKMTPETLVFAGSTTKAFTAAMMSILVDDNEKYPQIQWDTPIHKLIPEDFALENEYATYHTTIEDGMSLRSGLPRHDQAYGATSSGKRATVKEMIQTMRYLPLTAEPRAKYQYCNLMYLVAGHIIETFTGSKIGDLMKEHIWKPLDMKATYSTLDAATNASQDLAKGYLWSDGEYHEVPWMELDQASAAGCVISNVLDYAKWAQALMSKSITQKTSISKSGLEQLFRPRTIMSYQGEPYDGAIMPEDPFTGIIAYALGWRVGVYHGHQFYEHTGGMNAFGAEFILFPDIQFGVVAFANTAGTSNFVEKTLVFDLIDDRLGVPREKRFDWNKKNQETVTEGQYKASHATSVLFPNIPSPALSPTLPISSYAGKYYHPGYQNLTITYNDKTKTLQADRNGSTWPEKLDFEHASGNFFVITSKVVGDLNALFPQIYPAEFRVRSDGKVSSVGIGWEPEMGEEKVWLERVGDE